MTTVLECLCTQGNVALRSERISSGCKPSFYTPARTQTSDGFYTSSLLSEYFFFSDLAFIIITVHVSQVRWLDKGVNVQFPHLPVCLSSLVLFVSPSSHQSSSRSFPIARFLDGDTLCPCTICILVSYLASVTQAP